MVSYVITVYTGSRVGAGTDAFVTMVIKGTNGQTSPLNLDKIFYNDFQPGQADEYTKTTDDVGQLLMVKLKILFGELTANTATDWFVDRITIKNNKTNVAYNFPCYRWVQNEMVIFEGTAKLPIDEQHANVRTQRADELTWRRSLYKWGTDSAYADMPGYIKAPNVLGLPKDVRFTNEALYDLFKAQTQGLLNLGLMHLQNVVDNWENFKEYRKAFTDFIGEVPQAADHWREDSFYGSLFLNGCNPDIINRCTQLPAHFPVTQKLVGNLLDSGDTLEKAMANGRIYMVDYKILEDISHFGQDPSSLLSLETVLERRYMCASMGLLYVKGSGDLVPIAIQLHQKPSSTNPIWTPNDAEMDWICAKLWLRNSDSQVHQMITHLLRTHLCMEPVAVASYRQLPTIHPLWKLLAPHIRGIMAINTLGRDILISSGGIADQLLSIGGGGHVDIMKKYFKSLNWKIYNLPQNLKERGIDDVDKLPNFHFREDGLKMWAAVEEFVQTILAIYYNSDDDIQKDHELQNWIKDLHDNGYKGGDGHVDHGVPTSFTSRQQLYDFVTAIIFNCSCGHAAVNFSQMDVYGFPPNSPALMRQPPPTKKGVVTEQDLMKTLPNKSLAALTIATVYDLTRIYPDEKFIGDYSEERFTEEAAKSAIAGFQQKLKGISAEIKERNAKLLVKYPYLLPEQVPNSIAV